jgi:hypothetical protein
MRIFRTTALESVPGSVGLAWAIEINVTSIKRVRELVHVDLAQPEEPAAGSKEPLITRLSIDPILICDVLYALCRPAAEKLSITDEAFGQSMGGESLQAGQVALFEELADFFQKLGRTEKASMIRSQQRATTLAVATGTKKVEGLDLEAMVASAFGDTSTSSPGSSESTPDPTPSESSSGCPKDASATSGTAQP